MADELDDMETLKRTVETKTSSRAAYPKPVVFHDGRLAFMPTPAAALAMYVYLPFAVVLAVVRIAIYVLLPWRVSSVVAGLTGVRQELRRAQFLLDKEDRQRMSSMLAQGGGDVVVCPEGMTCQEPYLLRFSPLFVDLAAEVIPMVVDAHTAVFYTTSTRPVAKSIDSVYFLMNPRPEYNVRFLEPVRMAESGGKSSIEVANEVQSKLAAALGFEGTALTGRISTCCWPERRGRQDQVVKEIAS
ncbi:Glycerol-3-phosphate acyltransferase 1 [Dichanthelium oligosanthes]|uniref:Glycerol-3-phosphate acyltransferase 1 n=1 Tax=Dichanthelium oligosanthes TaxID=888268 RepID=A0A1E5V8W7_9POAL|nr:Glycerol-3-phosphate acyltransferase 1 [Dichanthelium oligosanthes]